MLLSSLDVYHETRIFSLNKKSFPINTENVKTFWQALYLALCPLVYMCHFLCTRILSPVGQTGLQLYVYRPNKETVAHLRIRKEYFLEMIANNVTASDK